eukprot:jgi/Mesvir1/23720/Mv18666-RA.1
MLSHILTASSPHWHTINANLRLRYKHFNGIRTRDGRGPGRRFPTKKATLTLAFTMMFARQKISPIPHAAGVSASCNGAFPFSIGFALQSAFLNAIRAWSKSAGHSRPLNGTCRSQLGAHLGPLKEWLKSMDGLNEDDLGAGGDTKKKPNFFEWIGKMFPDGYPRAGYSTSRSRPHANAGRKPEETKSWAQRSNGLLPLLLEDGVLIITCLVCLLVASGAEVCIPHYITASIFTSSAGGQAPALAWSQQNAALVHNVGRLVAASAVFALANAGRSITFSLVGIRLVSRLRIKLLSSLLHQEMSFFDERDTGELISRLTSDCQAVSRALGYGVDTILRNFLQFCGSVAFLAWTSWQLMAVVVAVAVLRLLLAIHYGRWVRAAAHVLQDTVADSNMIALEAISKMRVVRVFGAERREEERFFQRMRRVVGVQLRMAVVSTGFNLSNMALLDLAKIASVVLGGIQVLRGAITTEQLARFMVYVDMAMRSALAMSDKWAKLMEALGATERVFELLDAPRARQLAGAPGGTPQQQGEGKEGGVAEHKAGCQIHPLRGRIELQNVSFFYPSRPDIMVLKDVSLVLEPGQVTAFVGHSGSGKSTIMALLMRLYEPTAGQILVDGKPLQELDARWFRSRLGVVTQDPQLFNASIADNIAFGVGDAWDAGGPPSRSRIEAVARLANAHEFIVQLSQGYNTTVGDRTISGGQRQRIAIARALLREPTILILDEATSALDAESEHLVMSALDRAMRQSKSDGAGGGGSSGHNSSRSGSNSSSGSGSNGEGRGVDNEEEGTAMENGSHRRTVLVIAHRLSTVRAADQIVVLKEGRVAEVGVHSELMQRNGEYTNLVHHQLPATEQEQGQPLAPV